MTDRIEVLTHSSIRIKSEAGTIYLDPFHIAEEAHDADYILVTHDHFDHFSPEDIAKIAKEDTILVVPEKMAAKAQEVSGRVSRIETVAQSGAYKVKDLSFETIPAYNVLKPFHPKGAGWVGYILNLGEDRIYIAGDTDATKENKAVQCDIALIPIGGTYTMDAKQAAGLINTIRPKVAIPTHYGTVVGKKDDAAAFAKLVEEPVKVEIKMQN